MKEADILQNTDLFCIKILSSYSCCGKEVSREGKSYKGNDIGRDTLTTESSCAETCCAPPSRRTDTPQQRQGVLPQYHAPPNA